MTGILPIKKNTTGSALSNFEEYTILDTRKFVKYTGFLEDEVKKLCEENDVDFNQMKEWYDGYALGADTSVYNPSYYNDEQALRSVIRMAYIACVDRFIKIEELPSGHGSANVVYLPVSTANLPALIIELKWNKTSKGAIALIKRNNYPAVIKEYYGDIVLVGIDYNEKDKKHLCTIEKLIK